MFSNVLNASALSSSAIVICQFSLIRGTHQYLSPSPSWLLPVSCYCCYCCCCATATTTTTAAATIVKYYYLLVGFNLLFVNNAPFLEYVFVLVACNTYFCKPNKHTFRKQYYYCYVHTAKLYTVAWVFIISHFLSCHQSVKPTIFRFLFTHSCTLIYLHANLG